MYKTLVIVSMVVIFCFVVPKPRQAQHRRGVLDPPLGQIYGNAYFTLEGKWTLFGDKRITLDEVIDLHGNDLSGKTFSRMFIDSRCGDVLEYVNNLDFSDSSFNQVCLLDYNFRDCDFSRVKFYDVQIFSDVDNSNFQDAWINNSRIPLSRTQLLSTASYKAKNLVGFDPGCTNDAYRGINFAGFDLRYSRFRESNLTNCDFTDAIIEGINLSTAPKCLQLEQLLVTKDFKQGLVKRVNFQYVTWPKHVVDLSRMIFIDCEFNLIWVDYIEGPAYNGSTYVTGKVDLTDSVISGCNIGDGITLENIKSTWNYKHNRMEGIKLPDEIQKALDAEKKQP
jgi:hypothetical protein